MQQDFKLCFCLGRAQRTNLLDRSFDEATAVAADAGARDQIQQKKGQIGDKLKHHNTKTYSECNLPLLDIMS